MSSDSDVDTILVSTSGVYSQSCSIAEKQRKISKTEDDAIFTS